MEQSKLRPWHGIVVLAFFMLVMFFVLKPVQKALGAPGLFITEGFIALTGIAGVFVFGGKSQDLLPIAKTRVRYVVGSVFLWLGGYFLSIAINTVTTMWFPETQQTSQTISDMFGRQNLLIATIIPALMAGVCEELMHRGMILSSLRPIKSVWLRVLICGAFFGLFHMSPFRFFPTAVMGGVLAFVVLQTGNIIIAMALHTLNDLIGFMAVYFLIPNEKVTAAAQNPSWSNAITQLVLGAVPFIIGGLLMRRGRARAA